MYEDRQQKYIEQSIFREKTLTTMDNFLRTTIYLKNELMLWQKMN